MGFSAGQLFINLHFWACLAVAPLIVVLVASSELFAVCLLFLFLRQPLTGDWAFCASANTTSCGTGCSCYYGDDLRVYSTAINGPPINGEAGLYWALPAISSAVFFSYAPAMPPSATLCFWP